MIKAKVLKTKIKTLPLQDPDKDQTLELQDKHEDVENSVWIPRLK